MKPFKFEFFLILLPILISALPSPQDTDADPAQYVNPFIGTLAGGHAFPGATLPWGSVKASADSRSGDNQAGYVSDGSPITGISQLHDDGTGGSSSLGHFQLLPLTNGECAGGDLTKCMVDRDQRALGHGEPSAEPGYFSIPLSNGVSAEVTVTQHTALHRFTYPPGIEEMTLLLDVTSDLAMRYQGGGGVHVSANPNGTRITGSGRWIPSFGQGTYAVFFCFDAPHSPSKLYYFERQGGRHGFTALNSTSITEGKEGEGEMVFEKEIAGGTGPAGVLMSFSPPPPSAKSKGKGAQLEVRIGISWTSTERACKYAAEELPLEEDGEGYGFEGVKTDARARWNQVLSTVELDTTNVPRATLELFWSSLYRSYIAPVNVTGDNPLWKSEEPYWDSFYCIWDTFRTVHPLLAITAPQAQAEILRAVVDVARRTGWLPDCRMSTNKGFTQGGSNADSLLSDGWVKGIGRAPHWNEGADSTKPKGLDWPYALTAMLRDATVMGDFEVQGRGGVNSRRRLGYVPAKDKDHPRSPGPNTRSASRLLEYAYNDFSIALVAQGLAQASKRSFNSTTPSSNALSQRSPSASAPHAYAELAKEYFVASHDWRNIWNPNATHQGFSGFVQPRKADGEWFFDSRYDYGGVFRPDHCSPVYGHNDCFLGRGGGEFYEASSWEYSFYVPHDMAALVEAMGGKEMFSKRLDKFFEAGFHDMGDEPGFLPTYLYNYVGEPVRTVDRVDATVAMWYNNSLNGLPGNDDSGSMGAYAVWSHLGFFPVAGQDTYLLNRPYFPKITLRNDATGAVATIIANNLSPTNKYIQSATLNGEPYTRNWISHSLFSEGGTLVLEMGSGRESGWGTGEGDVPMSLSTGGFGAGEGVGKGEGAKEKGKEGEILESAGGVKEEEKSERAQGFFPYLIFLLLAD